MKKPNVFINDHNGLASHNNPLINNLAFISMSGNPSRRLKRRKWICYKTNINIKKQKKTFLM